MKRREFKTAGIGGLDLHAQAWLPDSTPRAVIALAHGLGEHSGRYERVASRLVAAGHAVYALDHRGHGRSPGPRADIGRFDHVVSDFCAFAGRTARQHPGTDLFLLGHSLGGAIAFASALRLQDRLRGVVLSAPALAIEGRVPGWQQALVRVLAVVAPGTGVLRLSPAAVSRDPQVVREYETDPLVHHGAIPARTAVELLRATRTFPALASRLRLPVLILHGTADRLVPLAPARPVHDAIASKDRTLRYYEKLYHEVFNEPEHEQVMADLLRWLAAH
ncbi:MAG TPA: alpha/beta hydrolase [Steroidobacteraceae bacterium]